MTVFGDAPASARHLPDGTTRAERFFNRFFDKKEIVNCDRDVYLHRWYIIRKPWFALFLHKFVRSDEDRALHDHPWDFLVIPIWRGYFEHREQLVQCPDCAHRGFLDVLFEPSCCRCNNDRRITAIVRRRVLPILGTRFRPGTYKHRVDLLTKECPAGFNWPKPSWSLFIRFREFRDWGFHLPEGWMQWNKFWQEKCE